MSYTASLVDGLAALLQEAGLGAYRPAGPAFTAGETGIVMGVVPEDPDRLIALTPYPVQDTGLSDVITAVQVRMRAGADPRDVEQLADGVFDVLDNRRHYWLGPIHVVLSWRNSQAQLGQDSRGRMELAANYYLRTTRTSPNLDE